MAFVPRPGSSAMHKVPARRCVKATGQHKDCPANQVIVSVRQAGHTPHGQPYDKMVQRCVTPRTAHKKGYAVLRQGTLPVRHRMETTGGWHLRAPTQLVQQVRKHGAVRRRRGAMTAAAA